MPFDDDFYKVYGMLKVKLGDNFEFNHAGEEGNQQNILKDIIQPLYESDIIIADLTGLNPNVLYELGVAHTLNKKTIIITKDELSKLPFDLQQYRAKNYSENYLVFEALIEYLKINLEGAVNGEITFSNPIKDFLTAEGINVSQCFEDDSDISTNPIEDKGFLDFLTEIESDTEELTNEIVEMATDLNELTEGMQKSTKEIQRVKSVGGSGTTAFVRSEARKVGGYVEIFGKKLQKHNLRFSFLWNKIETNINGLLENKYSSTESNKKLIVNYIIALKSMQFQINNSGTTTIGFRNSMLANRYIEKSLTQAIGITDNYLEEYLDITQQMSASIERIIGKSKFVVGEIDFPEISQ
jgi:hypothetical protein